MSEFKIGQKVLINRGSWAGTRGIVESVSIGDEEMGIQTEYKITFTEKPFGVSLPGSCLESVETSLFENNLGVPLTVSYETRPMTQDDEIIIKEDVYMEGAKKAIRLGEKYMVREVFNQFVSRGLKIPAVLMEQVILQDVDSKYFVENFGEYVDKSGNDYIAEMAGRLPGRSQTRKEKRMGDQHGLIIAMGDKEKDYAHFHFFRSEQDKEKWNSVGGCIMMTTAYYYKHSGHDDTLNEDEMDALIVFLNSSYRNSGFTKWQQLVNLWNDNNYRYSIPDNTPMPPYRYDMPNYNGKK